MEQPSDRSEKFARPGYVCKEKKSVYVFRRAGELWNGLIHNQCIYGGFGEIIWDLGLYYLKRNVAIIILILPFEYMEVPLIILRWSRNWNISFSQCLREAAKMTEVVHRTGNLVNRKWKLLWKVVTRQEDSWKPNINHIDLDLDTMPLPIYSDMNPTLE